MTRRQEAIVMKFVLNYAAELLRTSLDTGPSFGLPDSTAGIAAAIAVYETVETLADSLLACRPRGQPRRTPKLFRNRRLK